MTDRYKLLSLDDVTPGMVLSDDLQDSHGNILLPRGAILSEATLASIRRHHIDAVPVSFGALSEADQAEEREQHRRRLACLFRGVGDGEASQLLMQYMMEFRLGATS